jgi:hypothetical protein
MEYSPALMPQRLYLLVDGPRQIAHQMILLSFKRELAVLFRYIGAGDSGV